MHRCRAGTARKYPIAPRSMPRKSKRLTKDPKYARPPSPAFTPVLCQPDRDHAAKGDADLLQAQSPLPLGPHHNQNVALRSLVPGSVINHTERVLIDTSAGLYGRSLNLPKLDPRPSPIAVGPLLRLSPVRRASSTFVAHPRLSGEITHTHIIESEEAHHRIFWNSRPEPDVAPLREVGGPWHGVRGGSYALWRKTQTAREARRRDSRQNLTACLRVMSTKPRTGMRLRGPTWFGPS
jgi:hypothetical protein